MRNIVYFLLLTFSSQIYSTEQDFETLYSSLKPFLEKFTRPFTVLDYDSESSYFAFRIAKEFPLATCIIAGKNSEILNSTLPHLAESDDLKNIILLSKPLTIADLKNFAHTEHFDIMLAFNPIIAKNFYATAKTLSDNVVVPNDQEQSIKIIPGNGALKIKPHWFSSKKPTIPLIINENHQSMTITPPDSHWSYNVTRAPGISLITFLALQGSWPDLSHLEEAISNISWKYYSHLAPWDIIVTGAKIEVQPFSLNFISAKNPKQFVLDLLHMTPSEIKENLLQENSETPK